MRRFLIPIILVIAAVGLFMLFTSPKYQEDKGLSVKVAAYNDALDKSKELKARRDELLAKRRAFNQDAVQKLEHVLPDNVDNIRLLIDINNIANRHQLVLQNLSLGDLNQGRTARNEGAVGPSGDPVGSVEVGFSVTSEYNNFLAFLVDLEHSLRIVDVQSLDFSKLDKNGVTNFNLTIKTYWLH